MLGAYIGQFLPLSGGTLGGALNLGGHDLSFFGNITDSAGNTRIQVINSGSDRALNLLDDANNVTLTVSEGGVTLGAGCELLLNANWGMIIDGVADLFGDGSGNLIIDSTTTLVNSTIGGSSGTISGTELLSSIAVSGSVNAIGTVLATAYSGSTTGKKYIASFRSGIDLSYVDSNGNFIKSNFSAAQAIYVDGTNGSDSHGNGMDLSPFLTIAHALSVAPSGACVFVGPGAYNITQLICPNGVSLVGAGMDITVLNCTGAAGLGPAVIVGTGTVVSDLTINSANGHNIPPVGFQASAGIGSTQTSTQFYLRRLRAIGDIDGFYIGNKTGFYSPVTVELRDCVFASNYDTFQIAAVDSTSWPITIDVYDCQFLPTKKAGGSSILRCITGAATKIRLFNCLLSVTDTLSTTVGALGVYAGVSISAFGAINFEMYGTTVNFNIPNIAPSLITTGNYNSVGVGGTGSTVKIGAGNTFDPNLMGVSTAAVTFLPAPGGKAISNLAVTSSAVAPYAGPNGNQFEVAVDAGTLTANTLTISNPGVAAGIGTAATTDGMETRYRIKNTNSGSTGMTLSLGSAFNAGSTTLSTVAAGKRAYLTFQYDADNSMWDLTGFVNGL
jgi:hypothetical protein